MPVGALPVAGDVRDALTATDMKTAFGPVKFVSYGKKTQQNKLDTYMVQWQKGDLEAVCRIKGDLQERVLGAGDKPAVERVDLDADLRVEAILQNAEVAAYVKRLCEEVGNGGGYILSTACSVAPRVEPWKLELLVPLAEEIGRYL